MTSLITWSARTGKIAGLCFGLLLTAGAFTPEVIAAAGPQDTVRGFYETLLGAMRDGRVLGQSGLNYLMRQNQGAWQISDVYLDGTISQVAVQRSEFHSILRRDGVDGLIMALNRKVDLLGRGVAKAS